jgi:hypothetical protein
MSGVIHFRVPSKLKADERNVFDLSILIRLVNFFLWQIFKEINIQVEKYGGGGLHTNYYLFCPQ